MACDVTTVCAALRKLCQIGDIRDNFGLQETDDDRAFLAANVAILQPLQHVRGRLDVCSTLGDAWVSDLKLATLFCEQSSVFVFPKGDVVDTDVLVAHVCVWKVGEESWAEPVAVRVDAPARASECGAHELSCSWSLKRSEVYGEVVCIDLKLPKSGIETLRPCRVVCVIERPGHASGGGEDRFESVWHMLPISRPSSSHRVVAVAVSPMCWLRTAVTAVQFSTNSLSEMECIKAALVSSPWRDVSDYSPVSAPVFKFASGLVDRNKYMWQPFVRYTRQEEADMRTPSRISAVTVRVRCGNDARKLTDDVLARCATPGRVFVHWVPRMNVAIGVGSAEVETSSGHEKMS